jgi:hypothetical protein
MPKKIRITLESADFDDFVRGHNYLYDGQTVGAEHVAAAMKSVEVRVKSDIEAYRTEKARRGLAIAPTSAVTVEEAA